MSNKNRNRQFFTKDEKMEDTNVVVTEKNEEAVSDEVVETKEVVSAAPAVVEAVQTKTEEVKEEPKDVKRQAKEGFKPVFKIENSLASYAEAMDRKNSIVPEEGGRWQYSLYTTIKSILNTTNSEDFTKEWSTLLHFFNKNKDGIFNENFIFRFPEQWPGSTTEFTIFRRIVYMVIQTADPKERKKALASINMAMVVEGLNEDAKNKIFSFYGV